MGSFRSKRGQDKQFEEDVLLALQTYDPNQYGMDLEDLLKAVNKVREEEGRPTVQKKKLKNHLHNRIHRAEKKGSSYLIKKNYNSKFVYSPGEVELEKPLTEEEIENPLRNQYILHDCTSCGNLFYDDDTDLWKCEVKGTVGYKKKDFAGMGCAGWSEEWNPPASRKKLEEFEEYAGPVLVDVPTLKQTKEGSWPVDYKSIYVKPYKRRKAEEIRGY